MLSISGLLGGDFFLQSQLFAFELFASHIVRSGPAEFLPKLVCFAAR